MDESLNYGNTTARNRINRAIDMTIAISVAIAFALIAGAPLTVQARPLYHELAYVEFYDPDESSGIILSVPTARGSGHDQKESAWRVHVDIGVIDPTSDWIPTAGSGYTNRLQTGESTGIRIERMLTREFGIEYGTFRTRSLSASGQTGGNSLFETATLKGFSPYYLGVNLHISPERLVDFYMGVHIANADLGSLRVSVTNNNVTTITPISSNFGWGASAGVDVPIGRGGWVANANLRFMQFRFRYATNPVQKRSFKAYLLNLSLGYRF